MSGLQRCQPLIEVGDRQVMPFQMLLVSAAGGLQRAESLRERVLPGRRQAARLLQPEVAPVSALVGCGPAEWLACGSVGGGILEGILEGILGGILEGILGEILGENLG